MFHSLLSAIGKEMGMIEDLYVCVYMLNAVKIKLNYVSV